jgi:S-adenosylmethionine:tRNA ribosyltransferase-isomerase
MQQYSYELPDDRIARYPLPARDASRLLIWKNSTIQHDNFIKVADYLKVKSLLVFNDTRVIPARLIFTKATGARIELFLLAPVAPTDITQDAMTRTSPQTWKCTIGNLKRWTAGTVLSLEDEDLTLHALLEDKEKGHVTFSWQAGGVTFSDVVRRLGNTPLPPYLGREGDEADVERYQTIYARNDGAVAAPTAGLHFTDRVMATLTPKDIRTHYVTLHVSAGTFLPVKVELANDHVMHEEQVIITPQLINALMDAPTIVAVGTTSLRVLESIYWYGCILRHDPAAAFIIPQFYPYGDRDPISLKESLQLVEYRMGGKPLPGHTSLFILPGYQFKVVDSLLTNFHQPGSTLLLLVAAFAGPEWEKIYDEALKANYRFLSYGDSSLLVRTNL